MPRANPFSTLGLHESVVQGLTDEQILLIITNQYRTLATIHHPDRGGKPKKFQEIQDAFETLKIPLEFNYWKETSRRTRKDRLVELEAKCEVLEKQSAQCDEALANWSRAFGHGQQGSEVDSPIGQLKPDVTYYSWVSAYNPPAANMLLNRDMPSLLQAHAVAKAHSKSERKELSQELIIDEAGKLWLQERTKVRFNPQEDGMPPVSPEWVCLAYRPPSLSYYWEPQGNPQPLEKTKLFGSIKPDLLKAGTAERLGVELIPLVPERIDATDFRRAQDGYHLEFFSPYLKFIRRQVIRGQMLVAIEEKEANDFRFKLLGCPVWIVKR